jgi:hypothetical protein
MDGTIVDLYGVDNWLGKLRSEDFSPYEIAKPLVDLKELSCLLNELQDMGSKIGIITWGSKFSSEKFVEKVKIAKEQWLHNNMPDVKFDEFVVMDYSCNKASSAEDPFGILFDDDKFVRAFWPGASYPPEYIFPVLRKLLKEGENFEGI